MRWCLLNDDLVIQIHYPEVVSQARPSLIPRLLRKRPGYKASQTHLDLACETKFRALLKVKLEIGLHNHALVMAPGG